MSGIVVKFKGGPITFEAESAVSGGQVVVPGTKAGTVKAASSGADDVLGVALTDAGPDGSATHVAVACGPAVVPVASDDSAGVGDLVVADADGAVKAADTEGVEAVVGRVIEKQSDDAHTVLVRLGI